jgi:hypothetical protein
MGEAWTIPCIQIWLGGLVPGVAVVAQSLRLSHNSTTTLPKTRTLYLKLTLKDLDWKPLVLPFDWSTEKCGQFDIDVNGLKHAAEYLNSSKVKYDDDIIDNNLGRLWLNFLLSIKEILFQIVK